MGELEPHYARVRPGELAPVPRNPVHVVLDNLRSAYNVGSIFRTADAGAVAHIHLCGMSAHPPHKKLEKTALGAFDYVPWTYHERATDAVEALAAQGVPVVAVEVRQDAVSHVAFAWPRPVAVVFGNEVHGVQERVIRRSAAVVAIPMRGVQELDQRGHGVRGGPVRDPAAVGGAVRRGGIDRNPGLALSWTGWSGRRACQGGAGGTVCA